MIGVGRMGTQHARAYVLNPKTEIVTAADSDPENLELFHQRFGVPVYSDYHEMLRIENIDIAAPILPVSANPSIPQAITTSMSVNVFCLSVQFFIVFCCIPFSGRGCLQSLYNLPVSS